MSKTSDYWKMRELENRHRQQTLDFLDAYNKQIDDIYKYMLSTVQKEIDAFYGKYASDEGITMAEAKKRAAQLDIEAYARKAKRYVANKTFTKKANAEMKLYNLTMKVNRLELLKSNMGLELVNGFDDLEKLFGDTLTAEGVKEFRRQAGILGETIVKDDEDRYERLSDRMARASFHNATFSDRIWMHQDLLKGELNKALQQALISGASMERLARNIRNAFGVSTKNAQRLMRTEIRRMQTDVAMESYKRNGNEEYEYMALGRRPCEACRELDGKVYKVKKMEVGLNAPPMHPNCMCSTAPHVDEKAYQEWLEDKALGLTGNAENGTMNTVKSITADDYYIRAEGTEIHKEVLDVIFNTVKGMEDKGGMYFSDVKFGRFVDPITHKEAYLQTEQNANGLTELNISTTLLAGKSLREIDAEIAMNIANIEKSLKEAVIHECGHAKTYYGKTALEVSDMNNALMNKGIYGISEIAMEDGAEAIAEIEVLLYRGENIPKEGIALYEKYTRRKEK